LFRVSLHFTTTNSAAVSKDTNYNIATDVPFVIFSKISIISQIYADWLYQMKDFAGGRQPGAGCGKLRLLHRLPAYLNKKEEN
jgi:hypothetical protein